MTEQSKKILKGVGITVGILLILGIGIMIYFKSTKSNEEDEEENPYIKPKQAASSTNATSSGGVNPEYTKAEIKRMQSWLLSTSRLIMNTYIERAITDSGGLDGVIGSGFRKAEAEAIRIGLLKDRNDLYIRSNK